MTMRARLILLTLLVPLCLAPSLSAQQKGNLIERLLTRMRTPNNRLDPAYIYQRAPSWRVGISSGVRQAGISQTNRFDVLAGIDDPASGEIMVDTIPGILKTERKGKMETTVGISVGYGGIGGSLSRTLGKDKKHANTTFSFDLLTSGYNLQLQYFDFRQPMAYSYAIGDDGFDTGSGETENPARMRALIADVFYTFRKHRFDYSAVYKGGKLQRRSAGSWMFGGKVILGEVTVDPDELVIFLSRGAARQSSAQVAFGGGFSYNWVPYHRQPYGEKEKGLRNLTANVTFLPMVTLFNQFSSDFYELDGENSSRKIGTSVMNGNLLVNYVARAGVSYCFDRFSANLSASFDSYSYKGKIASPDSGIPLADTIQTTGRFSRWTVAFRVGMKF